MNPSLREVVDDVVSKNLGVSQEELVELILEAAEAHGYSLYIGDVDFNVDDGEASITMSVEYD